MHFISIHYPFIHHWYRGTVFNVFNYLWFVCEFHCHRWSTMALETVPPEQPRSAVRCCMISHNADIRQRLPIRDHGGPEYCMVSPVHFFPTTYVRNTLSIYGLAALLCPIVYQPATLERSNWSQRVESTVDIIVSTKQIRKLVHLIR